MGTWQVNQQTANITPQYTPVFNRPTIFGPTDIGETEETDIDYVTDPTPEQISNLISSITTADTPFQHLDRKHLLVLSQIEIKLKESPAWRHEWQNVINEKRDRWINQILAEKSPRPKQSNSPLRDMVQNFKTYQEPLTEVRPDAGDQRPILCTLQRDENRKNPLKLMA
jgi:hypothetical protein